MTKIHDLPSEDVEYQIRLCALEGPPKLPETVECTLCGAAYPRRSNKIYCSVKCRNTASNKTRSQKIRDLEIEIANLKEKQK